MSATVTFFGFPSLVLVLTRGSASVEKSLVESLRILVQVGARVGVEGCLGARRRSRRCVLWHTSLFDRFASRASERRIDPFRILEGAGNDSLTFFFGSFRKKETRRVSGPSSRIGGFCTRSSTRNDLRAGTPRPFDARAGFCQKNKYQGPSSFLRVPYIWETIEGVSVRSRGTRARDRRRPRIVRGDREPESRTSESC